MKSIFESRNKFNQLVKSLRDDQVLDEDNLKEVFKVKAIQNYVMLGIYIICFTPVLLVVFSLLYCFATEFQECFVYKMQIIFTIFLVALFLLLFLLFNGIKETWDDQWRRTSLLTNGDIAHGTVTEYVDNFYTTHPLKYISYRFSDQNKSVFIGEMKTPHIFCRAQYKIGDEVQIAYEDKDPNFNIIITEDLKKYNLRKNKDV